MKGRSLLRKKKKKKSLFKSFCTLIMFILMVLCIILGIKIYQNGGGLQGVLHTALGTKKLEDLDK